MKDNLTLTKIASGAVLGLALSLGTAMANQIDYSSTVGSYIDFVGNSTFQFTPSTASFVIDDGTAAGLTGEMTGVYTIGAITTLGLDHSAPVTGSGLFEINDGSAVFTATLTWVDINQFGTGGGLDTTGTVNLTGISYNGTNPDLVALDSAGAGADVLTFQFVPAVALTSLKSAQHQTTFSGSIAFTPPPPSPSPDQGSTLALLGGAMLAVGAIRRKLS